MKKKLAEHPLSFQPFVVQSERMHAFQKATQSLRERQEIEMRELQLKHAKQRFELAETYRKAK